MITWNDIFSANLGKMMAIQIACAELVVKNKNWNVDFEKVKNNFRIKNISLNS